MSTKQPEKNSSSRPLNPKRRRVAIFFTDPSRAQQHCAEDMDINNIMNKYRNGGGILPSLIRQDAKYGDFSDATDYQESMNIVLKAQEQFAALSAETRDFFQNDPEKFLAFANNPKNGDALVKMGLATPKAKKPAQCEPREPGTPPDNNNQPPKGKESA